MVRQRARADVAGIFFFFAVVKSVGLSRVVPAFCKVQPPSEEKEKKFGRHSRFKENNLLAFWPTFLVRGKEKKSLHVWLSDPTLMLDCFLSFLIRKNTYIVHF
jgi:hypothetical protein